MSNQPVKVLVTGATGFVGRAVVQQLTQRPRFTVAAAVRRWSPLLPEAAVQIVIGDLRPQLDWSTALDGVHAIVHLAARAHVIRDRSPDPIAEFRLVNVDSTLALARQAAAAGVRRFVFMSSVGVNGNATTSTPFCESDEAQPREHYAWSKYAAEQALRGLSGETGLEVVIVRAPLVHGAGAPGNFGRLCRLVRRRVPLPFGAIDNRRSVIGVGNLADFTVTCLDHPRAGNETFLVSDAEDVSTPDLVVRLGRALGVRVRLLPVPAAVLRAVATLVGAGTATDRLVSSLQVNISKARRLLGWAPPLSLDEGLRQVAARS
jgi:UDP-glucose 4-epimerase